MRNILRAVIVMVLAWAVGLGGQDSSGPRKTSPSTTMAIRVMRKDAGKGKRATLKAAPSEQRGQPQFVASEAALSRGAQGKGAAVGVKAEGLSKVGTKPVVAASVAVVKEQPRAAASPVAPVAAKTSPAGAGPSTKATAQAAAVAPAGAKASALATQSRPAAPVAASAAGAAKVQAQGGAPVAVAVAKSAAPAGAKPLAMATQSRPAAPLATAGAGAAKVQGPGAAPVTAAVAKPAAPVATAKAGAAVPGKGQPQSAASPAGAIAKSVATVSGSATAVAAGAPMPATQASTAAAAKSSPAAAAVAAKAQAPAAAEAPKSAVAKSAPGATEAQPQAAASAAPVTAKASPSVSSGVKAQAPKAAATAASHMPAPVISGRAPTVVWKRGMSVSTGVTETAAMDAETNAPPPAIQVPVASPATSRRALTPVAVVNPAPRVVVAPPTREELLAVLSAIQPGTSRADVISRLGKPAYAINMSDAGSFVERCRFRAGGENLASIEFRDGVVALVNRLAP